jgi:hypothetical protein
LSGGYSARNHDNIAFIQESALPNQDGWQITLIGPAATLPVNVTTFAQCFDNPPPH